MDNGNLEEMLNSFVTHLTVCRNKRCDYKIFEILQETQRFLLDKVNVEEVLSLCHAPLHFVNTNDAIIECLRWNLQDFFMKRIGIRFLMGKVKVEEEQTLQS